MSYDGYKVSHPNLLRAFVLMFKIAIIFSFALCLTGLYFGLHDQLLYSNYEIGFEKVSREKPVGRGYGHPAPRKNDLKFLYSLSRRNSNRIVCFVVGKKDGSVEMNPRQPIGFLKCNYGLIQANTDITKSMAKVLFGEPVNQDQKTSSYSLIARSDLPATKDKKVLLDLKFEDGRLHEFRIRSNELESTDWIVAK